MKNKFIIFATSVLALASCSFLDVVPENTATLGDSFTTTQQAKQFLYRVYNYMPNTSSFRWAPDMCAGGDLITGPAGDLVWFGYRSVLCGNETPDGTYFSFWDGGNALGRQPVYWDLYKGIKYAYMYISNVDSVPDMPESEKTRTKGEAYFLIAYLHWTLMQYYGPVVIIDHEIPVDAPADEMMMPRSSWDDCVNFVTATFDTAASMLNPTVPNNELGRATSVAAKAYKARVLMYAASPLVNGNEAYSSFVSKEGTPLMPLEYDNEKWKKALDAIQEAITLAESNGYALYKSGTAGSDDADQGRLNYYHCFVETDWADQKEYLFAIGAQPGEGVNIQRIAGVRVWDGSVYNGSQAVNYTGNGFRQYLVPTLQIAETFLTEKGLPLWADPDTKDKTLSELVADSDGDGISDFCQNRDPRFYATIGYDGGDYTSNSATYKLELRYHQKHGYTGDTQTEYNGSCTGYVLQKFISVNSTYDESTNRMSLAKYPFPYLRLAELYLDYAEADFEYDGSLSATGLGYLNKVRDRAGLPDFEESWNQVGMPSGEDMRKALHYENMAELACECRLYHNLRRWNLAQEWLGHTPDGLNIEGESVQDFNTIATLKEQSKFPRVFEYPKTNWLPIPRAEIENNNLLVQNPGYN